MNILSAKEIRKEELKPCRDNYDREWAIEASDIEVRARLDDGSIRQATQRVLSASISTLELTMSVVVGQTQEDYHAQLQSIFNAHAPGNPNREKSDE